MKKIIKSYENQREKLKISDTIFNKLIFIKKIRNRLAHHQIYQGSLEEFEKIIKENIKPVQEWIEKFYK